MTYEEYKALCVKACHEREACKDGYQQLLEADSILRIMLVWRKHWNDIVTSKFSELVLKNLNKLYKSKAEINRAGIYFNECPPDASPGTLVIVGNTRSVVTVSGYSRVDVLGKSRVVAIGHAQVFVRNKDAQVSAYGHTNIDAPDGTVQAYNNAHVSGAGVIYTHNAVVCNAFGGKVYDYGHYAIDATRDTEVFSNYHKNIKISDSVKLSKLDE